MALFVQKATQVLITGTSGTISLAGVTSGNVLIATCSYYRLGNVSTTPLSAPTDNNGVSPLTVANVPNALSPNGSDTAGAGIWYKTTAESGTHQLTFTNSAGGGDMLCQIIEIKPATLAAGGTANDGAVNANQTRTSGTTSSITGTNSLNVVCLEVASGAGSANINATNPPSGYTSIAYDGNTATAVGTEHAYKDQITSGTQSVTWTWTDATTLESMGIIAVFTNSVVTNTDIMLGQIVC